MVSYRIPETLASLAFKLDEPVFMDIETQGLYVDTRLVQLYQPGTYDDVIVLDTDIIDLDEIKKFIAPLWSVWYNASYDLGLLGLLIQSFKSLPLIKF